MAAVTFLLTLGSAFRGLYFLPQQMGALLLACVAAGGLIVIRWRAVRLRLRSRVEWAALAVVAAYLLSGFLAVQADGAVQALLLRCLYLLVFWMAAELALMSSPARTALIAAVICGGLVAAATGLLAAAGVPLTGAFVGGRIYTLIQYPDAAAAYLAATFFLALGQKVGSERSSTRQALGVTAAILLFAFTFALSRGAEVVFIPLVLCFLVALGRASVVDGLASVVISAVAAAAAAVLYIHGMHQAPKGKPPGATSVAEAMAVLVAVSIGLDEAWHRLRLVPARLLGLAVVGVAALTLAGGIVVATKTSLANGVVARLGRLSVSQYNAWSRFAWMRDALKMVAKRPILGWGGGGWAAAYHAFQSYNYSSSQVHNGWLQTMVATGVVGFVCWLAVWVLVGWCTVKAYRRATVRERPIIVGLAAAAAMIGGHGLIDFTLSLGAISIALWAIFGLLRSASLEPEAPLAAPSGKRFGGDRPSPASAWATAGVYAGLVTVFIFAALQLAAQHRFSRGVQLANSGQLQAAVAQLNAATKDDPWFADAYADLGDVYAALAGQSQGQQQISQQNVTSATQNYRKAVALNPYNYQIRQTYGAFLQGNGLAESGLEQLRTALTDSPYVVSSYDDFAHGLVQAAVTDIQAKDLATARSDLAQLPAVAKQLAQRSAAVPGPARAAMKTGQLSQFPSTSPGVQLSIAQAAAIQGQWSTALQELHALTPQKGELGAEANLWLGAIEDHQGQTAKAQPYLQAASTGLGSNYSSQLQAVNSLLGKLAGS